MRCWQTIYLPKEGRYAWFHYRKVWALPPKNVATSILLPRRPKGPAAEVHWRSCCQEHIKKSRVVCSRRIIRKIYETLAELHQERRSDGRALSLGLILTLIILTHKHLVSWIIINRRVFLVWYQTTHTPLIMSLCLGMLSWASQIAETRVPQVGIFYF
jgi:hypothetical protein